MTAPRASTRPGRPLRGETTVPGDKSITQRAVLLGALAPGRTRIEGGNPGGDARAAVGLVRALGVKARASKDGAWTIEGGMLRESAWLLDARNSGTALRLSAGLLSAQPFLSILTGDASLRTRPVDRVILPLRALGARLLARDGDRLPPLVVQGGPLRAASVKTGVASAQVKSAVLLAAIQAEGLTDVEEPVPTRDHTERMLPVFGAIVERDARLVRVHGPSRLHAAEISVPGDASAAAFLLAAASLVPRSDVILRNVGMNPTRTGFLEWLLRSGASIERLDPRESSREPVADLRIRAADLSPAPVAESEIPGLIDELPLLAVVAAFGSGALEVRGARELKLKESDRIAAVAEGLQAIGADVTAHDDGWTIRGKGALRGGTVDARGDHRIAMAFLVAGLRAKEGVRVEGADAAAVSDPGFLARLRSLAR